MNDDRQAQDEKEYLFDNPKMLRFIVRTLAVLCALLLLADLVIHRHVVNAIESMFGFYAFFGFGASVVIVLLAKEWRKVVMRSEDYYDPVDK